MLTSPAWKIAALAAALCLCLPGQNTPAKDAPGEAKGLPPRATPADYQAQAQAGAVTIAAEFKGHALPLLEGPLTSEDYIVVETGLFGSPGARTTISFGDFSLRINGKKTASPAQPYGLVAGSVKDPEWEPPAAAPKSKTSVGGGSNSEQGAGNPPPEPVKVPLELRRAMAQRVQKAALPEGDRMLPQAGLIFFQHRGKVEGIRSLELIYTGAGGKATLKLQP
jgi:hypothetical protein